LKFTAKQFSPIVRKELSMLTVNGGRRRFLAGLAGLGASAAFPSSRALGQESANPRRIDFHHHYCSPAYLKLLTEQNAIKTVMGYDVFKGYSIAKLSN
jgi:hypothetical protein